MLGATRRHPMFALLSIEEMRIRLQKVMPGLMESDFCRLPGFGDVQSCACSKDSEVRGYSPCLVRPERAVGTVTGISLGDYRENYMDSFPRSQPSPKGCKYLKSMDSDPQVSTLESPKLGYFFFGGGGWGGGGGGVGAHIVRKKVAWD